MHNDNENSGEKRSLVVLKCQCHDAKPLHSPKISFIFFISGLKCEPNAFSCDSPTQWPYAFPNIQTVPCSAQLCGMPDLMMSLSVGGASWLSVSRVCSSTNYLVSKWRICVWIVWISLEVISLSLRLCSKPQIQSETDSAYLLESLAENFMDVVQYNEDNRAFEVCEVIVRVTDARFDHKHENDMIKWIQVEESGKLKSETSLVICWVCVYERDKRLYIVRSSWVRLPINHCASEQQELLELQDWVTEREEPSEWEDERRENISEDNRHL